MQRKQSSLWSRGRLGLAGRLMFILLGVMAAFFVMRMAVSPTVEATAPVQPASVEDIAPVKDEGTDSIASSSSPFEWVWSEAKTGPLAPAAPNDPTDGSGNADILYSQSCMADVFEAATGQTGVNCTANDISVSSVRDVVILDDGCAYPGDMVTFSGVYTVPLTAQARHDVGIYFAEDGTTNALTGTCSIVTPAYAPDPPWLDLDGTDDSDPPGTQDTCGDINDAHSPLTPVITLTVVCVDNDGNGYLDLPWCTSWRQPGANDLCTSPLDTYPGTKSKCNCEDGFDVNITVPEGPELHIDKQCTPDVVEAGGKVTCTVAYSNTGDVQATSVWIEDNYNQNKGSVSDISDSGVDDGDVISWTIGTVAVSARETVSYVYTVNTGASDGDTINNTAVIHSDYEDPLQDTEEFDVVKPAISIVKEADPEYILSGDTVDYSYYVTNASTNTPLTDVVVTDDKCTPVEEVDVDDLLNPAEIWEYLCTKSVTEDTTNTGTVTAQPADASGDPLPGIDSVSDDDTATVNVVTPTIQVEKTADPTKIHSGETVEYTYEVTNIGNVALDNVSVEDLDHTSCEKDWGTDELAVDETWTYVCNVLVSDDITNTAEVEGHGAPLDPGVGITTAQDTATVDVIHPAIEVVKTADPTSISSGEWVTYTYRVENTGDDPLTDVEISDDKCDSPTIEDGDPDTDPSSFEVGDVLTYTCSMTLTSTTSNEATVTGTDSLNDPVVDTSSPPVQVKVVVAGFEIDKSASADAVHVGDTVTYTYEVSNTSGPAVLTDVVVTDDDDRCSDLGDPAGDDNGNGLLDAGETWTYSCTVTMGTGDKDETTNIFNASAVVSSTGESVSDEDQYTVEVLDPSISVVKSVDRTIIQSGDTVTYTYEVENTGNVSVTVDISDDKCDSVSFVSSGGSMGLGPVSMMLEAGEIWTYQCKKENVVGDVTNTVTVTGTDKLNKEVTDTDQEAVDVVAPVIEIAKTANPTVTTGGAVDYTYEVKNSGEVALHIDDVVDDQCASPDYESGDNSNGWLDVDETWTYKCTRTGVTADITNTVVVTATPVDDDGHTLLGFDQITDTTKATVDVVAPAISVVKTANPTKTYVGKTVVYTYTVTNDGDTVLTDIQVDDRVGTTVVCSPDTPESKEDGDTDDLFEPGETWVYTCTQTVDDTTDNTVTVSGQPSDENGNSWDHIEEVSDSDTASVEVIHPRFSVVKEPSAEKISPGDTVTYTYTVENTGDDPLDPFEIEDDKCDPVTGPAGVLGVGETWTYSCTAILNNDTTNTVVVTGTDSLGKEITRTTDAFVDVVIAGVDVEKMANEYTIHSGDTVTYTFTVSNTSEGVLTDVVVTDDHCAPVYKSGDDGDGELEQGELWVYECMTDTMDVTTENEVLATATVSDTGEAVSDTAHVEVVVLHPAITVTKSADKTVIRSGSSVKYTYEVRNSGDTPLSSVTASDPDCNPGSPISGDTNDNDILETNETWTYECPTVIDDDTTNTVTASGLDSLSKRVTAQVSEFVDVVTPTIEIVKTADPTTIPAGEETTVQYTYVVENTGEVTLSSVNVSDDLCQNVTAPTGDDGNDDLLSPDESWTYQCSMGVSEEITNTATANGRPWDEETSSAIGSRVSDTDKASVEIEEEEEVIPVGGITLPALPFALRSLALLLGLLFFGGVAIGGWRFNK